MSVLRKNIGMLVVLHCTNYVFPLLLLPYLVRVLGSYQYGVYSIAIAAVQYFNVLTDFGYNLTATRQVSINRNNKAEISQIFWTTISAKIIILCLGTIIAAPILLYKEFPGLTAWVLIACLLSIIGNIFYPLWYFQGMEKMLPISVVTIIARLVVLALTFLLIQGPSDLTSSLFVFSLAYVIPSFALIGYLLKNNYLEFRKTSIHEIFSSLRSGFPIFIGNFAITFYTTTNVFIIGQIAGAATAGNFYAADRIRFALQNLLSPISQALYPRFCAANNLNRRKELRRFGIPFVGGASVLGLILWVAGPELVSRYLGAEAGQAPRFFQLMTVYIPVVATAMVFGHWWLAASGRGGVLARIYCAAAVAHVAYLIPLIRLFSIDGVIYATLITQIVVMTCMAITFWRERDW